jgi:phosphoglycolate phosphatase
MKNQAMVLFDLDGTLIDTAPDMHLALNILLDEENLPSIAYEKVRSEVSNGVLGIFSVSFSDDPIFEGKRYNRYLDIYQSVLGQKSQLFENVTRLLDELDDEEIDYGVVTNKSSRFTLPLLKQHGLMERLKVLVCGDEVKKIKPDPEPLFQALDRSSNQYHKDKIYYVGDAEKDIQAANAANIESIACSYGYRKESDDPGLWNSDYLIDNLIGVIEIVRTRA